MRSFLGGSGATALVVVAMAVACSGSSNKVPDECIVKGSSGPIICSENTICGAGAQCDTGMSPSTCVKVACVPNGAPCSSNEQCKMGTCTIGAATGDAGDGGGKSDASVKTDAGISMMNVAGTCGAGSEGGVKDSGAKPNLCTDKGSYVFDDLSATPNGFGIAACGAYADAEKAMMIDVDAARASQFITPLAGAKLPITMPYKFTWSTAMFPNAPTDPGMDPDNKANGIGFIAQFIDINTSKELLRVHTMKMDYTPDDTAWAKIVAAANMPNPPGLQLKITAVFFIDNAIPPMNNPVIGTQPRLIYLDTM